MYPSHPLRGVLFVGVVTGLKHYKRWDTSFGIVSAIQDRIPRYEINLPKPPSSPKISNHTCLKRNWVPPDRSELVATTLFAGTAWLSIVTLRRYALQSLFTYQGWMFDERGKMKVKTKLWIVLLRLLIGTRPNLYSYQSALPYLPVPNVKDTMNRVS